MVLLIVRFAHDRRFVGLVFVLAVFACTRLSQMFRLTIFWSEMIWAAIPSFPHAAHSSLWVVAIRAMAPAIRGAGYRRDCGRFSRRGDAGSPVLTALTAAHLGGFKGRKRMTSWPPVAVTRYEKRVTDATVALKRHRLVSAFKRRALSHSRNCSNSASFSPSLIAG
jgi:hypothetical protein